MQDKLTIILQEDNAIYKLRRCEDTGEFVGAVFNPETGQTVKRLRAQTERSLQAKLIRYIYSNVTTGNEIISDDTVAIEATNANDSAELE